MQRMPPAERRLGAHLPLGLGMVKAVDRAGEIGANAIQVFADNPTAWRRRLEPPKELPAFQRRLAELSIAPVAIHASYLVNLAGPDEQFHSASIGVLASELRVAPGFRARFVNVHVGSHRGAGVAAGTDRLADGLRLALAEADGGPDAAMIALENSAGGGFGLGSTSPSWPASPRPRRRRGIRDERLGFCLDTAHAWAAGIDLPTPTRPTRSSTTSTRGSGSSGWSWSTSTIRSRSAARGSTVTSTSGRGRSGRRGSATCSAIPALAHAAYYLETPGMDEGYDADQHGAGPRPAGRPPARPTCRPRRWSCAAAGRERRRRRTSEA